MIVRSAIAVFFILLMLGATQTSGQSPADGVEYEIRIDCPGQQNVVATGCPIRAVDGQDAMGDPSIAVDPDLPNNLIIGSLHGSGDRDGPSNKSRQGQAFTTFTSNNHGASWFDSPFTPPSAVGGSNAYGQHPQVKIDPYGHVFVGSLYAVEGFPEDRYEYVIAAQKFASIGDIRNNQQGTGDYNAQYIYTLYPGNEVQQFWYLYNRITDNMTIVWSERTTPYSEDIPQKRSGDVLPTELGPLQEVPALRTAAYQAGNEATSVIGVAWTNTSMYSGYQFAPRSFAIGPCSMSTNPVLSEGMLYIGCKVEEPDKFAWNEDTEKGQVEMFRMDPDGGEPQYIGPSPIIGGNPKLGVRSDGRIALMTVGVADEELRLDASYGKFNAGSGLIEWTNVRHYGDELDELPEGATLKRANIQDMIYREYSGVLHLILKQNVEYEEVPNVLGTNLATPTITKSIIALDESHGFLAQLHLDIGNIVVRAEDNTLLLQSDAVFDDLADDFLELPPDLFTYEGKSLGDTYQREFFAIGDYGTVIFAELMELTNLRGPAVPSLPPPPPPPVPAPAAATTATATAGAALVSTSIMLGAAAANKRKTAVKARK